MNRSIAGAILISIGCAGPARAQSPAAPPAAPDKGYAEVVAQSAFGNVTSQSFGGEFGVALRPGVQIFVDGGLIRDAAPSTLGSNAQRIAIGIAAVAGSADFHVRQPVTFVVAGVKYIVPVSNTRALPYVLVGGGFANVNRDVTFSTAAGDVTQFAAIGTDLSGSKASGMLSLGGGVQVPMLQRLVLDFQYRYGRVLASDGGFNANRAGIGVGVRF